MGDIVFIVTGTKQNRAPEFLSYDYESMIGPPIFSYPPMDGSSPRQNFPAQSSQPLAW